MSKKTENIYKALENLSLIDKRLEDCKSQFDSRELNDIEYELKQEIKNLNFWIESLYSYNGKSKSYAKKNASRENGKKGGRPPKVITDLRKRNRELEESIPQMKRKRDFSNDVAEVSLLDEQIESAEMELAKNKNQLELWEKDKNR
ncbi:MAG: hypothetical protein MJ188_06695 [Treponema sp.]|nr:hypothetical protein [Treponema sp.]